MDRTLASRHECKYFVPEDHIPAVRAAIRPFMRPDRFASRSPGNRYQLSSLYLDSPELDLYRSTEEGHKNRFKLRIRAYDDNDSTPVFMEIKRRVDGIVLKTRAPINRRQAASLLAGEGVQAGSSLAPAAAEFLRLARGMGARPALHVRYVREAYEALGHVPVRVTFDRSLYHAVARTWTPRLGGAGYAVTPLAGVILEVKFTDDAPSWVHGLINRMELQRRSIPKYVMCVDTAQRAGTLQGFRTSGRSKRSFLG